MIRVQVSYTDGVDYLTLFNGTEAEAIAYYEKHNQHASHREPRADRLHFIGSDAVIPLCTYGEIPLQMQNGIKTTAP